MANVPTSVGRLGPNQLVAITNASSAPSSAVGNQTYAALISATVDAFIAVGKSPTAAASNGNGVFLPAKVPLTITLAPGEQIAGIAVSTSGSLSITEIV